jgi:hypothetical protein
MIIAPFPPSHFDLQKTSRIAVPEKAIWVHPLPSPEPTNPFCLQIEGLSEAFYKKTHPFVKGFVR